MEPKIVAVSSDNNNKTYEFIRTCTYCKGTGRDPNPYEPQTRSGLNCHCCGGKGCVLDRITLNSKFN